MGDSGQSNVSRRTLISTVGVGTGMATLGGCVSIGGDEEPADGDGDDDGMADSLTIWSVGTQPAGMEAVAEAYNEETGDDVEFTVSELDYEELHDNTFASIAAGSGGPDIGTYEGPYSNQLVGTGGLVDLSTDLDPSIEDAMVDWTWDMVSDDRGEGRYGVPVDIAPVVTFYNREIYDEVGIEPGDVETYDDFIEYADEAPDDVNWMTIGTGVFEWHWEMLLRQQDGEAYDENGNLMLDTEETHRAADVVYDLFETGTAIDLEEFTTEWATALNEGEIATVTSGAWMAGSLMDELADQEGQWGIHAPPAVTAGGGRATNHGGSNLVVPAHKDAETINRAIDFLEFALGNEEQVMTISQEAGIFPAHEGVYDDEWWSQDQAFFGGDSYELIVDLAADIPTMRLVDDHREVYERMGDFFADYVADEYESAEEMAADAEEVIASEVGRDVA